MMSNSSEFHTGGIVLLAVGIVFCGISVAVLLPLIHDISGSQSAVAAAPEQSDVAFVKVGEEYAEFVSSQTMASQQQLTRAQSANGFNAHGRVVQAHAQVQTHPPLGFASPMPANRTPAERNPFAEEYSAGSQQHSMSGSVPIVAATGFGSSAVRHELSDASANTRTANVDRNAIQQPSGSVFAPITVHPVTVNVHGSMFEGEVKALTERVESAIKANQQNNAVEFELKRQAKSLRTQSRERRAREDEIAKIGDGVEQLATSFRQLQQETRESLLQVQQQASRSQVSTQLLESYRHALEKEQHAGQQIADQKLAQQQLAQQQFVQQQLAQQQQQQQQQIIQQQVADQRLSRQRLVIQQIAKQRLDEQELAERALAQQQQQRLIEQTLIQQRLAEQTLLAQQRLTEQQLAMQQAASTRVAARPAPTYSDAPPMGHLPPLAQPPATHSELVPEPRHLETKPVHEKSSSVEEPEPLQTARSRTSVSSAAAIPVAAKSRPATQVVLSGEGFVHRGKEKIQADVKPFVIPTLPQLAVPPVSVEILPDDSAQQSRSLHMLLPLETPEIAEPQTYAPPAIDESLPALPIDINLPPPSLRTLEPSRKVVEHVGYEHVYRFKMEEADDGEMHVVADRAAVCAQCGKVHTMNDVDHVMVPTVAKSKPEFTEPGESLMSAAVMQASGNLPPPNSRVTASTMTQPKPSSSIPLQNAPGAGQSHTANTHVGGRGMNRHLQQSEEKAVAEGLIPKIRMPSFTTEDDEPGILHRLSSTIKQLGRSVQ